MTASMQPQMIWHTTWFNLFEAACWSILAVLVLLRFLKHRRSALEPLYALAFLLFGLSDVLEAWALTSWLIWLKFWT